MTKLPDVSELEINAYMCILDASQKKYNDKNINKNRESLALDILRMYKDQNKLKPFVDEYIKNFL